MRRMRRVILLAYVMLNRGHVIWPPIAGRALRFAGNVVLKREIETTERISFVRKIPQYGR